MGVDGTKKPKRRGASWRYLYSQQVQRNEVEASVVSESLLPLSWPKD